MGPQRVGMRGTWGPGLVCRIVAGHLLVGQPQKIEDAALDARGLVHAADGAIPDKVISDQWSVVGER